MIGCAWLGKWEACSGPPTLECTREQRSYSGIEAFGGCIVVSADDERDSSLQPSSTRRA